jgi:raffinose/stachyose/melibiose transport system substrate-binding protein
MGDFQWMSLAAMGAAADKDDFGMMPAPLSDDANDPLNTRLGVSTSYAFAIDTTASTVEQQDAAKAFLEWYVNSASGQDFMVNQTSRVPAYSNVELTPTNPLSRSTAKALEAGTTYAQAVGQWPADHWVVLGDAMIKYMAGELDRAGFAATLTDYWQGQA